MFKPLNDRILIKPDKVSETTPSGIILATKNEEKAVTGRVIQGDYNLVKDGDRVLFSKFGYDEVEIDKETYYVVSLSNILGKFND